ncbi:acyltransferase family protein [Streptomyces sp. NPDC127039]|uniref:acyltransferase family protein n=1 Tax=Streptomyces sp. NPDC127039 TaxID=3347115 RepID=UPI003650C9D2
MPQSPPPGATARKLPSLTGLRFIAAFLVFAFHVTFLPSRYIGGGLGDSLGDILAKAGFYGVCFFFVLSGFVLTWSARTGDTAPRLWRRRLVKIYPNHLVTFVLAAVLMTFAAERISGGQALANLFLVQTWLPDMATTNSMNAVSWSLACEAFFYLAFPLLLRALKAIPARLLWPAVAVVAALMIAAPLVARSTISGAKLPGIADGTYSFEQIWFVYFFPPVRVLEFVLGMLLALIVRAGRWPRISLAPAVAIAVAGYVVVSYVPYLFSVAGSAALWLAPLVAAAALADTGGHRSPLRGRVLVRLGEISFAFYMVHGLVVTYGHKWLVQEASWSPAAGLALALAAFAVSLALAHALFSWVESPLVRRFSAARPRPVVAPAAGPAAPKVLEVKE